MPYPTCCFHENSLKVFKIALKTSNNFKHFTFTCYFVILISKVFRDKFVAQMANLLFIFAFPYSSLYASISQILSLEINRCVLSWLTESSMQNLSDKASSSCNLQLTCVNNIAYYFHKISKILISKKLDDGNCSEQAIVLILKGSIVIYRESR